MNKYEAIGLALWILGWVEVDCSPTERSTYVISWGDGITLEIGDTLFTLHGWYKDYSQRPFSELKEALEFNLK